MEYFLRFHEIINSAHIFFLFFKEIFLIKILNSYLYIVNLFKDWNEKYKNFCII